MNDEVKDGLLIVLIITALIILCVKILDPHISPDIDYQEKLNTCAKQHNVYECELIAVPKKGVEHE